MTQTPIKFGMSIAGDPDSVTLADQIGLDLIGLGDAPALRTDVFIRLAGLAQRVKRARVGTVVTVPVFRHPMTTASSILTVQQLSNGRAFLGIGTGITFLENMGEKPSTLRELEEYGRAVQALCAGQAAHYHGKEMKLAWRAMPPRVPIWVAGDGPKTLRLAGRFADGVMSGNTAAPELVRWLHKNVAEGAKEAGRDPSEIEIWDYPRVILAKSEKEGIEENAYILADYANVHFRHNPSPYDKGVFMNDDIADRLKKFRGEFRMDLGHRSETMASSDHNVQLVKKYGLYDWLAEQLLIAGPPEVVVEKLQRLVDAGARNFYVRLMPDHRRLEELSKKVFDHFR